MIIKCHIKTFLTASAQNVFPPDQPDVKISTPDSFVLMLVQKYHNLLDARVIYYSKT